MSKHLGIKSMMGGWTIGLPALRHLISFASYRHRIFCKPCNAHYKHLEDEVIPLLVPMARGRTLVLGTGNQALLALWAAKTAIALLASKDELRDLVPPDHRQSVRYASQPPADCRIGYFPWRGREIIGGGETTVDHPEPSSRYRLYRQVFTFGAIGFTITGVIDPLPSQYVLGLDEPFIRQFWPSTPGMLSWPPETAPVNESVLHALSLTLPVTRRPSSADL
jgi:hypothetical protein